MLPRCCNKDKRAHEGGEHGQLYGDGAQQDRRSYSYWIWLDWVYLIV